MDHTMGDLQGPHSPTYGCLHLERIANQVPRSLSVLRGGVNVKAFAIGIIWLKLFPKAAGILPSLVAAVLLLSVNCTHRQ